MNMSQKVGDSIDMMPATKSRKSACGARILLRANTDQMIACRGFSRPPDNPYGHSPYLQRTDGEQSIVEVAVSDRATNRIDFDFNQQKFYLLSSGW